MTLRTPVKALLFDLGDVLFTWSAETTTTIPAKTLRDILKSDIWDDFDCGRIDQNECYVRVGERFGLVPTEVDEAFTQAFNSLQSNAEVIAAIRRAKKACKGLKVFAMSNMPKEFHTMLAPRISRWALFDLVFISGLIGMRKPSPAFYEYVLQYTQMRPQEVMFFDDKPENVLAAQAEGIRAYVFKETAVVTELLAKLEHDPFEKGCRFLVENKGRFDSITNVGVTIPENFALLLIQENVPFIRLINAQWDQKSTWNFFIGEPDLTLFGKNFPDDLDTTSLALMVVPPEDAIANSVLDHMLGYLCSDGRVQTYFDRSKLRFDEIVSTNVLACFYHFGRGEQLLHTLDRIYEMLMQRTYIHGSHYYSNADCCLYFVARLLRSSDDVYLHAKIESLLRSRLTERVGHEGSAIELAMRIVACCALDIDCDVDLDPLLAYQQDDGGWPVGWMYGNAKLHFGNRGVTTALAVRAIADMENRTLKSKSLALMSLAESM